MDRGTAELPERVRATDWMEAFNFGAPALRLSNLSAPNASDLGKMNRLAVTAYTAIFVTATGTLVAEARPAYARNEQKPCGYCHVRAGGGGERGFRGMYYGANGLSFNQFDEKREALIAGLAPDTDGRSTVPAISYNGNIVGPALQQTRVAALRGPVIVLFLEKADEASKASVKAIGSLAKSFGTEATILGIAKTEDGLKLTKELGGNIRIYADLKGEAAKEFGATNALDIAVIAKLGTPLKTFPGFSRSNLEAAIKVVMEQGTGLSTFDLLTVPEKLVRGAKL